MYVKYVPLISVLLPTDICPWLPRTGTCTGMQCILHSVGYSTRYIRTEVKSEHTVCPQHTYMARAGCRGHRGWLPPPPHCHLGGLSSAHPQLTAPHRRLSGAHRVIIMPLIQAAISFDARFRNKSPSSLCGLAAVSNTFFKLTFQASLSAA